MEKFLILLILALLTAGLIRLMLLPMKLAWKLLLNGACGLLSLWLISLAAGFTGISIPINAVTATIAGSLGFPGILLLVIVQFFL